MDLQEKIIEAIEPALLNVGYNVVQVRINRNSTMTVSVDIENQNDSPVTIQDCVTANRLISTILDVENFIVSTYNLEVGSSGEYRPLTKICDYERFCDKDVKIELHTPLNNKRRLSGQLLRLERSSDEVIIYLKEKRSAEDDNVELAIPYKNISKASVKKVF